MPNINITLPESSQSITRPVIFEIIDQVRKITKINKETKIFFPGDSRNMQTPGSGIDSNQERYATFGTNHYTFIEVEEDYDPEALGTTAVAQQEHIPVFLDTALGIYIAPIYATSKITINFKYRCPSKTEALRWRDDMRMKISQLRDINLHNITYHYLLPMEAVMLLKTIHERRETIEGYGQSFEAYFTEHTTSRLTLVGDLAGQESRLAVSETQMRLIGMYDFDGLPEKIEKDDQTGTWMINFGYKFTYEKPIAVNMKYPIMVHNQLLPRSYIAFVDKNYDPQKVDRSFTLSLGAMNYFESDSRMDRRRNPQALIRLPDFDDYSLPSAPVGTGSVFVALSNVNLNDRVSLLNLTDLSPLTLDQDILAFFKAVEYPYLCDLYSSIFHLSLYRNDQLTHKSSLTCDLDLNVKASSPLNLRHQHRVRLSLVTDLTLLKKSAIDRLRAYPKALVKTISAMNEILRNLPDFVNLGDQTHVSALDFNAVYMLLTGYAMTNGQGVPSNQFYSNGLRVNAWPSSNYQSPLLNGIDPNAIEHLRRYKRASATLQVTGVIAQLESS